MTKLLDKMRAGRRYVDEDKSLYLNAKHDESSEANRTSAFCPVLYRAQGYGICKDVNCGACELLAEELSETVPDYVWICAKCLTKPEFSALGHWTDGDCENCGFSSSVLALAVPAK